MNGGVQGVNSVQPCILYIGVRRHHCSGVLRAAGTLSAAFKESKSVNVTEIRSVNGGLDFPA